MSEGSRKAPFYFPTGAFVAIRVIELTLLIDRLQQERLTHYYVMRLERLADKVTLETSTAAWSIFSEQGAFMTQARRVKLFAMQRTEMWSRWKLGQSLHEIGWAFGKDHGVIDFMLSQHDGIAPAVRHRSFRTLKLVERESISRGIASDSSIRVIAKSQAGYINSE
jgi:hypothetical protein